MTLNQINLKNQYGEQSINQIVPGANGLVMTMPSGAGIYSGAAVPSFSAPAGSAYYCSAPGSASTLLYVNPTVGNNWVAVTVP